MSEITEYPIDEFGSFELSENSDDGQFTITLKGQFRYANMLTAKIAALTFSKAEVEQWVESSED
jgi:hypothetical protein